MSEATLAAYAAIACSNDTTTRMLCKIATGELSGTSAPVLAWVAWREQMFSVVSGTSEDMPAQPEAPV